MPRTRHFFPVIALLFFVFAFELHAQVAVSPSSLSISSIVGLSDADLLTITNSSNAPLTVQSLAFTGPNASEFSSFPLGNSCQNIPPQGFCVSPLITFEPQATGGATATLLIYTTDPSSPTAIPLSGNGVAPGFISASSPSLSFSVPSLGDTSAPQTLTLTNTGGATLKFTAWPSFTGTGLTTISNTCVPLLYLNPGASCALTIQVTPTASQESLSVVYGWLNPFTNGTKLEFIPVAITVTGTPASFDFIPISPCRVVDTRNPTGDFGGPEIDGGTTRSFTIPAGTCNIPATAGAYSLNVTSVPDANHGYMTVWPTGLTMPVVSTLNFDGHPKANAAIIPAGANGAISVYAATSGHVILDINGYFVPTNTNSALAFYPLAPCRIADTRNAVGALGGPSLAAGGTRDFPVLAGNCGIPNNAAAYSLNLTAVAPGPLGYLTAWPTGQPMPSTSTMNAAVPKKTSNAAIVQAGTNGNISVFTRYDTDLIIDVNGYFAPPASGGLAFYPLTPCRALDTRLSGNTQPFVGSIDVNIESSACAVPSIAQAYVMNATIVPQAELGFLTLWAQGESQPMTSTLNSNGVVTSNMAIVPTSNGSISAFDWQYTHLILDVFGYFAP